MNTTNNANNRLRAISELVIAGQAVPLSGAVRQALEEGTTADAVLNRAMIPAMLEVGRRMQSKEFFIPEVLMAAKAMSGGLDILKPHMGQKALENRSCIVLASVEGDLHDIGKNLVKIMFEGAGFRVIDLGINVPAARIRDTVKKEKAELLGLSCLITTCLPQMKEAIQAVRQDAEVGKKGILVGGAAVTAAIASGLSVAYAKDCAEAVSVGNTLLAGS